MNLRAGPGQSPPTCQPARCVGPRSIACQAAQRSKRVPQEVGDPTCTTAYHGRTQSHHWWTWRCVCTVYVLLYCTPAHNAVGPPRPPSSARGFGCYCTHVTHHARTRAEPFPQPRCHGLAAALAAMDDGPPSHGGPRQRSTRYPTPLWIAVMGTLLFRATQVPNGQMAVSFFFPYCRQLLGRVVQACAFWMLLLCVLSFAKTKSTKTSQI